MSRARNLKPGYFKNEDLAACGPWGMLLFAGLWTLADRKGRLEDRPSRIRVEIFPYAPRTNVVGLLATLEAKQFIVRYDVNDSKYIEIVNFSKHQNPHINEAQSTIPAPCSLLPEEVQSTVPLGLNPHSLIPSSLIPDSGSIPLCPTDVGPPEDFSLSGSAKESRKRPQKVWYDQHYPEWYKDAFWNHSKKVAGRKAYEKAINLKVDRDKFGYNQARLFLAEQARQYRGRFETTESWSWRANLLPASWLNGELWTDELGPVVVPKPVQRLSASQSAIQKAREEDKRNGVAYESH